MSVVSSNVGTLDELIDDVAHVEKQLDKQANSFQEHTHALQRCTARIKRDISSWEMALTNVHKVGNELIQANAAYVLPSSVNLVVSAYARGGSKSIAQLSAVQICDAIDALCHSIEYLETKPDTEMSDELSEQLQKTMRQVVDVASKYVVVNVTSAMRFFRHKHSGGAAQLRHHHHHHQQNGSAFHDFSVIPIKPHQHQHEHQQRHARHLQHDTLPTTLSSRQLAISHDARAALRNTQYVVAMLYDALSSRDAAPQIHSLVKECLASFAVDAISAGDGGRRRGNDAMGGGGGGTPLGGLQQQCLLHTSSSSFYAPDAPHNSNATPSISSSSTTSFGVSGGSGGGLYRKGSHPIVAASPAIRELTIDCAIVLAACIVEPMQQDYEVVSVAADVCCDTCGMCLRQATRVLASIEQQLLLQQQDESGERRSGAAAAPCPKGVIPLRHVDGLCVSLDLLEDFYNWKLVVRKLMQQEASGDAQTDSPPPATNGNNIYGKIEEVDQLQRCVDDGIEELRNTIGRILCSFLDNLGTAFPQDLVDLANNNSGNAFLPFSRAFGSSSTSSAAMSWLPPPDCLVHESTSNFMLLWKLLFSHYPAALRSVLAGLGVNLEDFVTQAFESHLQDLETFALAAVDLVTSSSSSSSVHNKRNSKSKNSSGASAPINAPLFVINNCTYIIDVLQHERSWQQQAQVGEEDAESGFAMPELPQLALKLAKICKSKIKDAKADCTAAWEALLPDVASTGITELYPSDELDRTTRDSVKQWYRDAHKLLITEQHKESSHTAINHQVRHEVQKIAFDAVSSGVERMEDALERRSFTTNGERYPLFAERDKVLATLFCMY